MSVSVDNQPKMVMDRELRDEWVKRLRSGEIKQGFGALEDSQGRQCCLGVLCDILVERGEMVKDQAHPDIPVDFADRSDMAYTSGALPFSTSERVFGSRMVSNGMYAPERCLASDNDGGKSFAEIAGIIEEVVEVR